MLTIFKCTAHWLYIQCDVHSHFCATVTTIHLQKFFIFLPKLKFSTH